MRILLMILFFILALTILFGAHWLIYKFLVRFFSISNSGTKKFILAGLLFLMFSFIAASVLTRFSENIFVSSYYYLAGTWYGLLVNLLLATAIGWLIFYVGDAAGWKLNLRTIGYILYGLALLFTLYGLWNAQNLQLKFVDAPLKNLPDKWQEKTAVQISDVHLGAINGVNYLNRIINKINQVKPDIIFITGDFFDGSCPCLDEFVKPLDKLNPPLGIYFVTGNHEIYEGKDKVVNALKNTKINVLLDSSTEIDGVKIIGLDYGNEGFSKDPTDVFKLIDKDQTNILLYHQPTLTKQAEAAGINLQLSGHVHHGQIFPINLISRLIFGKYYYGYYNYGDYSIYTSAGTGTWGPPVRTSGTEEITVLKFQKE